LIGRGIDTGTPGSISMFLSDSDKSSSSKMNILIGIAHVYPVIIWAFVNRVADF
jgi:hypothetical protein